MSSNSLWFFEKYKLWHITTDNPKATSCKDAAHKRKRLGTRGIPLYDELKSMCGKTTIEGEEVYLFLHCRASAFFNLKKVQKTLGIDSEIVRLEADELKEKFNAQYGTVNPFHEDKNIIQIFDEDIFNFYTAPHTLITNGGHFNIAIEFDPEELLSQLEKLNKKVLKVDIIQNSKSNDFFKLGIGIITGNGPDSGISLWKQINHNINDELTKTKMMSGDLAYPKVIVNSIPEMGLSMELDKREEQVWVYLKKAVITLCKSDIHYLALACHTTQYYEDRIKAICQEYDVVFYSMADIVLEHMLEKNMKELTVFAIPIVADLGKYSAYSKLKDYGLDIKPMNMEVEEKIEELGYFIKTLTANDKNPRALNMLGSIIKKGSNSEVSLIALTELSVLLERFPKVQNSGEIAGTKFIDGLNLYAKKFAKLYLDSLPKTQYDKDDSWE